MRKGYPELEKQMVDSMEDAAERFNKGNEIASLKDALEEAITGLEWWMEEFPEGVSNSDLDRIDKWKRLLK